MSRLDRIINWFRKPPQKKWPEYPREPAPPGGPTDPEPPPPPPPPPPFGRGGRPGKAARVDRPTRPATAPAFPKTPVGPFFKSCLGKLVTGVVAMFIALVIITMLGVFDNDRSGRSGRGGATASSTPRCVTLPQEPVEDGWRVMGSRWPRASFEVPPESFVFRPDLRTGLDSIQYMEHLSRTECLNLFTEACTEAPLGGGSVGFLSYSGTVRDRGISAAAEEIALAMTGDAPVPRPTYRTHKSWGDLVVASSSVEFETPTPQRSCRAPRVRITVAAMEMRNDRTAYLLITSLQGIDNAMTPELEERIMLTMRPR
ncbi:hypothetical protein AADG42_01505 [Ammonicoccus fulvus]|uniref:DUF8017 domain-containing protein n=1 Tax=Ammonicoccus fulvus TaxID=3138240 RepID=A0ABZ3FLM4_9ACTN